MPSHSERDEELFFWIERGEEKKRESIQSIHKKQDDEEIKRAVPGPQKSSKRAARAGLKDGWIRATFIVREENLSKLKALAYWERKGIKEVVDDALSSYLSDKKVKSTKR